MARFVIGLILGIFIGVLAASYEPTLPAQMRAALANLTTLVARGAEEAADKVADQAERAKQEAPGREAPPPAEPPAR